MNSSLTNNVSMFYITKYNFKTAVWYSHKSYLHYIHWNSKVTVTVNEIKTGSKLKLQANVFHLRCRSFQVSVQVSFFAKELNAKACL